MPATDFEDLFLDEDDLDLDDDRDDQLSWEEDDEFFDELDEIERREYIQGFLARTTKELVYDYDPNDYPYGYDLDV